MPFKNNQQGSLPLYFFIAVLLLLLFFAISATFPFKDKLLSSIFPKQSSQAAGSCDPTTVTANPNNGGPVIFNYSETVGPDATLGLQGDRFGSTPQVWMTVVSGNETALTPQTQIDSLIQTKSDDYIGLKLPANINNTLYAVWVKDSSGRLSNGVFINQARAAQVEFDELSPSFNFRIFGRNLVLSGQNTPSGLTPLVRFVDTSNPANSLDATVLTGGDAYIMNVKAPANLNPGTTYKVMVRNGGGGCWGEVEASDLAKGRTGGSDPLGLNVPWAADFNWTRTTTISSGASIQAAVDSMSSQGGGIVKLSAGTYSGFDMRNNVVVQGAGRTNTTINGRIYVGNASKAGLADTKVITSSTIGGSGHSKIFFKNNDFELTGTDTGTEAGSGFIPRVHGFEWNNFSYNLMDGNTINATGRGVARPFSFRGDTYNNYITMRNNNWRFINLRMNVGDVRHFIFEGNTANRDFAGLTYCDCDSGHLNPEYVRQSVFLNNTLKSTGTVRQHNDAETINFQGTSQHNQTFWGTLSGATANTVTDTTKNFTASTVGNGSKVDNRYSVMLMEGPGAGQTRYITNITANTLTLNRPWDVVPTNQTKYLVTEWDNDFTLVKGNTLDNNGRGIWLYTGGYDSNIVNNTLINTGEIGIRTMQHYANSGEVAANWRSYVADNTNTGNNGKTVASMAAYAAIVDQFNNSLGTYILGVEFRRNRVDANVPNVTKDFPPQLKDGYWSLAYDESVGYTAGATDTNTAIVLGTIFESNTAIDTANAYQVNFGNVQTIIRNPINTNVSNMGLDYAGPGGAKSNPVILTTAVSPQPVTNPVPSASTIATTSPQPTPANSSLPAGTSFVSDLPYTTITNGWGPIEKDKSNGEDLSGDGGPIIVDGTTYAKGLGTHAISDIRLQLNKSCTNFSAKVGVDDAVGSDGSVIFQVFADGTKLYDSGPMTGSSPAGTVNVNLTGKQELKLYVDNANPNDPVDASFHDWADWADAKVTCATTSSTLTVFVAGKTADGLSPDMDILINDTVVQSLNNIGGNVDIPTYQQYTYQHPTKLTPEMVKIAYTNDSAGSERSLRVDKIVIDGVSYESEATTTYSTGTWDTSCNPGFKQSEWLHCNGYFHYNHTLTTKTGDLDGNNKVDIFDFNQLLTNFGKTGAGIKGDLDGNNKVDIFDYNLLLTNFGK